MRSTSHRPADISLPLIETTVPGVLASAVATCPDRVALVDAVAAPEARRTWTYAELDAQVRHIALLLLDRFAPGERVAVWSPNSADWVLLQHGAALAGLVLVTVNPALRESEVRHVLSNSGAAGVFAAGEYRGFRPYQAVVDMQPDLPDVRQVVSFDDWAGFLGGTPGAHELPEVTPDDPCQIQYTSGTTGFPKAALLHHRGLVNASRFVARGAGVTDGAVWVNSMPMFHIGGGALTELGTFTHHGTYVLLPAFDPALQLELIETYRGTIMLAVPTMLVAMLDHPDARTRDLSSLGTVMSGASFVPAELVRRTTSAFGCGFSILFGQTEMHGVISQTRLSDSPEDMSETIGAPLPHVEVAVTDPATGEVVPTGEPGEICVRGYQTMLGYFGDGPATAAALSDDGWLHSGDLGTMDERGYLRIVGRLKDMVIRGGENVYPAEVEQLLSTHPEVRQSAVIGLPDPHWGEVVAAIVQRAPGSEVTPESLRAFCKERLASFKVPGVWFFVDEFPVTATGKIQKFLLRAWALGQPPATAVPV
ncbi:AMP-binding protein [Nakamurella sp. YIM 132087]|uniref:AMP-binding protein n=2 Tax=Nakamurella alba TaxID=2665158 RepID=A0A7K1FEG5_9ACTN|nr:AMP-binding protein [Nakamurella alba]